MNNRIVLADFSRYTKHRVSVSWRKGNPRKRRQIGLFGLSFGTGNARFLHSTINILASHCLLCQVEKKKKVANALSKTELRETFCAATNLW
jgi:hypothetical protein